MVTDYRTALAKIKRFDQLIAYLRDEMGWPIARDSFEDVNDLFYDFTAAELGIDAQNSAKIQEIKRLRPLSSKQPWGIFFVKFEPKNLPVVALRRILSQVALKKRPSANSAERAAWAADDLLFISNYGEGDERRISFAHFSRAPDGNDLPTLKVLGWDNLDTALHLDNVAQELTRHLAWPGDDADVETWRDSWRAAFNLRHREVVTTSRDLSIRLAELARAIRDRIKAALAIETEVGALTKLMKAFQEALVHDLDADGFADMYAQTIAYGLLSARIADPEKKTTDDFAAHMRTNPFLRELMEAFLHVGGRRGKSGGPGIDFDELGVSEVVQLLDDANMEAVVRDFGDRNPQEDPVIHFYELFLKEYDAKKRMQRGVFYTPRPVVAYIVRSVDELLRTEFGLADGLADITSWEEMAKRHKYLKIPADVPASQAFVQILDPATGTGTFLVEIIDVIYKTLLAKWGTQGLAKTRVDALWNEYVPKHLLPRLYGYELLMAPYAIAHLKIGLKLYETGYRFDSTERARIYLTNALEPSNDVDQMQLEGLFPALAQEAKESNQVKRRERFTVIVGNPPYSKASQNMGEQFLSLIERFRQFSGERIREPGAILFERDINNDYVKFFGLNRNLLERTQLGVLGMITSNSYLDGKNFRGLRDALAASFNSLSVLNLHGDSRSGAMARQGVLDENIFDIETGVSILLATLNEPGAACDVITYSEMIGTYLQKTIELNGRRLEPQVKRWPIDARRYKSFLPSESNMLDEYSALPTLDKIYGLAVDGIKTSRDGLAIGFTPAECAAKMQEFMNFAGRSGNVEERFSISVAKWDYKAAQKHLRKTFSEKRIFKLAYRPFDFRYIYYDPELVFSHREGKMSHLIRGENLALVCASRLSSKGFDHILPSDCLVEMKYASHDTNSRVFPVFLRESGLLDSNPQPNIGPEARRIDSGLLDWAGTSSALLALLNSNKYRTRYFEEIKNDFPGLPNLSDADLKRDLALLGERLILAQLLRTKIPETTFRFSGKLGEETRTPVLEGSDLYLSESGVFSGVSPEIFEFNLCGYQICKNWASAGNKSGIQRKGTPLSRKDVQVFRQVLFAIQETIAVRTLVDSVLKRRLGW
jgi:predicted helicase